MKRVILTSLITFTGLAGYSQATKALYFSDNLQAKICTFDPTDATIGSFQDVGMVQSVNPPRDFIYDAKNGTIIYQDNLNGLKFVKLNGDNVSTINPVNLNQTVMAPAFIPSSQKVVFFKVQRDFNGYGNNEESLTFSAIELEKSGKLIPIRRISDVSFSNVSAPFYGKTTSFDMFNGGNKLKEVALSKPLYIADKDLYVVLMRDVTGTNRLFKIKVGSPNAAIASNRCDYNIIDMAHVSGTDIVKALYFEKASNQYELKVGDFNINTNTMTNSSVVKTFMPTGDVVVDNGSIKFNGDQTKLFVTQFDGANTNIYHIDLTSNAKMNEVAPVAGNVQFDFGFTETAYKPFKVSSVFKLYPSPTAGEVYFMNETGLVPNSIFVYDNVGQLVKEIKVNNVVSNIKIDLSEMAVGVYHVKVDMPSDDFYGKVIVTR